MLSFWSCQLSSHGLQVHLFWNIFKVYNNEHLSTDSSSEHSKHTRTCYLDFDIWCFQLTEVHFVKLVIINFLPQNDPEVMMKLGRAKNTQGTVVVLCLCFCIKPRKSHFCSQTIACSIRKISTFVKLITSCNDIVYFITRICFFEFVIICLNNEVLCQT